MKYKNKYIITLVLVLIIFFTLFAFWPFIFNFVISFAKTDLMTKFKFVGLENYRYLFKDPLFSIAIRNNIVYLVVSISIGLVTSLLISSLIHRTYGISKRFYTAFFFIPVITSIVAASIIWNLLYYPTIGVFASLLTNVFGIKPQIFLHDPKIALFCIMMVDIWRDTGIRVIILLAGMEAIPDTLYEASRLDGASPLAQFFKITLPLLRPQIVFLAAISSISSIRLFTQIYMMSDMHSGGPMNSTQTIAFRIYNEAFSNFRFGYAATLAMVMFFILSGLVYLQIRAFEKKWDY